MINKAKEFEICTSDEPARARCEVDFVSYEAKSRMDLEGISEKILMPESTLFSSGNFPRF